MGLQFQFLRSLCQQLLAALQLVDAHVHVADGGHSVLPALTELDNLFQKQRASGAGRSSSL